jgi:rSAM/selenodomain-associated transferase 1
MTTGMRNRGDAAVAVMTRLPEAGRVKTRLQPELSGREAADLHAALTADLLAELGAVDGWHVAVFITPADRSAAARDWLGPDVDLRPQQGPDLGARMHSASRELLDEGYRRVIVVGTDTPGLDRGRVASALDALDSADLVLGPSDDGGYYLIGLKQPAAHLFTGVPWGSDRVLEQTIHRAEARDQRWIRISVLSDIDTWSDLQSFRSSLTHDESAKRLRRTMAVVARIFARRPTAEEVSNG